VGLLVLGEGVRAREVSTKKKRKNKRKEVGPEVRKTSAYRKDYAQGIG